MNIKQEILRAFRNHPQEFISGEYLSQNCNCTRAAVWKHIEELRQEGYEFEAVRKSGYRLVSSPDSLSAEEILSAMQTERIGKNIVAYETVPTTQALAHELASKGAPEGTLVVADQQTGGKGRLGRVWHSPKGTGIWMSLVLRPVIPIGRTPQMTLLTAVAMAKAIQEFQIPVKIKWPNDIFVNGKKVCGILTELHAEADRVNYLIIGIGINVNNQESDFDPVLQEVATSLRLALGEPLKRSQFIQVFCRIFEQLYLAYLSDGFGQIKIEWEALSMSLHRRVTVRTLQAVLEGEATGLNKEGVLLLRDDEGVMHKVYSADIEYSDT
ncbi:biotin--[acetyl-CoA-carboxylase] ligase [Brevibacillus laterosporus]|uniref:Bifunctional ligase/repressor BirA n=1 Tax=Brevibacillus laterosporus TaxID=1465 RepID=A0AAP8QFG8_BRELA|nr:biotin--[acetyl-CoA-carboxylase] ligase [Brevibacillus laterosporus]MED1666272.1 biotin--[acetyl-CoA-carboxylase] ligase [Brevibacillus laterosporus]MED1670595.1 biotin--[acetyl-CoA-carboxylase] ligase [Brevibacillus laterosporus]MED1716698.1 biotin--[acetyl-CoA-carboxylase] ligase [Brevibacillus laterosporus]PPA89402.1 biotin--[acetyl-CoA-carboxylase] ligase [Brevibacillus laterosporus]PPB10537.1 biotin--[acetyl-CoA-carboxylase] ligase [Brevibacillus laterosporus]